MMPSYAAGWKKIVYFLVEVGFAAGHCTGRWLLRC